MAGVEDEEMKEFIGVVAVILAIVGQIPYIFDILRNKTKPHVFSWIVWSIVTLLAFLGQWHKGGGPGSWTTGVTGIITIFIMILALKNGTKNINKLDCLFFIGALFAIIPWYLTKDPTVSIVIITTIDVLAFLPTIRKTLLDSKTETFSTYIFNVIRHGISIFALANYNLATVLYPSALFFMNIALAVIIGRSISYSNSIDSS